MTVNIDELVADRVFEDVQQAEIQTGNFRVDE